MASTATSSAHRVRGSGQDKSAQNMQPSTATIASSSQQQYPRRRHYELLVVPHKYDHEAFEPNQNTHRREHITTIGVAVGISKDTKTWSGPDYPLELWWRDAASIAPAVCSLTDSRLLDYAIADNAENARALAHLGAGYLHVILDTRDPPIDTSRFTVHNDQESFDNAVKDGEALTAETGIKPYEILISVDRKPEPELDWRPRMLHFKDTAWVDIQPFLYRTEGEGALPETLTSAVDRMFTNHHRSLPQQEHFTRDAPTSPVTALFQLMQYVGHWPEYRSAHSVSVGASADDEATGERIRGEFLAGVVQDELDAFVALNEDILGKEIRFRVFPGQQVGKDYQDMRAIVASREPDSRT